MKQETKDRWDAKALNKVWRRFTEHGWRNPIYAPKDMTWFLVVEPGSIGIHECVRDEKGRFWIDGDYPSRPFAWKPLPNQREGL